MPKPSKTLTACAAFLLALCALGSTGSAMPGEARTPHSGQATGLHQAAHSGAAPIAAEPQPEHLERSVRIAAFSWSKALPDASVQANLTIESALPFALGQVEVACAQFARSGVEIDSSRRTIAAIVPAGGRLQVNALDLGPIHPQAGSSGCRIVSVTRA